MLERLRIMAGDAALKDHYVVVDGPASGSALEFLVGRRGVKGIAPARYAQSPRLRRAFFLIDGARFGVVITVTPEELALREALETADAAEASPRHRDGSSPCSIRPPRLSSMRPIWQR